MVNIHGVIPDLKAMRNERMGLDELIAAGKRRLDRVDARRLPRLFALRLGGPSEELRSTSVL